MKKIKVNLAGNSYEVLIGKNIFKDLLKEIEKRNLHKNIFVITDNKILKIYRSEIAEFLKTNNSKSEIFAIKQGEESKNYETVNKIYSKLINSNFGRDTLIIGFGGGVVGDIAGFAASTFMRGVQFVQVPTTLLACVDSSVGGKTGINFQNYKNIIGTFYQPEFVLIDINFLKTLPEKEMICGTGELMKYAFLSDKSYFEFLNKNLDKILNFDDEVLQKIIFESVKIKSAVVSQDEKETGLRKILNLGHTFAHAYESNLNYQIKHGEAVIAGLINASILSFKMNLLSENLLKEYLNLLTKLKITNKINGLDKEKLYSAMLKDKKNREGKIKFVLRIDFGKIAIDVEAIKNLVLETLNETEEILFNKKSYPA